MSTIIRCRYCSNMINLECQCHKSNCLNVKMHMHAINVFQNMVIILKTFGLYNM